MAKLPSTGVPEMGSAMSASGVWVANSTGVTASGQTT